MRRRARTDAGLIVTAALFAAVIGSSTRAGAERSLPVDCLPDRMVVFNPVAANPQSLFGAAFVPGILLGPPGESVPFQGSLTVASLGFGGSVTVVFDDVVIEDGPGPDFIVFENAFFKLPLPETAQDDFHIFAEPGIVEVSADGVIWHTFPFDADALQASAGQDLDKASYLALTGLSGLTPTFVGNWTAPNDPTVFDAQGVGGVSGAGGDAFDLADVGLSEARFVRVTDADTQNGFPGPAEGFDLDAVIAIHARPRLPQTADSDGDRLSDAEELVFHGSNPNLADSDGDGVDDGREVAGCRDPGTTSDQPFVGVVPRLWLSGTGCTELRWTFMGTGHVYDVVRGELVTLIELGGTIDLGTVDCLSDNDGDVRWACDAMTPESGEAFFYLVRIDGEIDYGHSSALEPRQAVPDCP